MGWQSFARWGSGGLTHQATSQQSSAAALQTFLDGLMDRLHHLASAPTALGPFQDFFTRLADMVNDLRGGSHTPAPQGVADNGPVGGQAPAPQSNDGGSHDDHSQAPVAPQSLVDDDDTPGSDDAQDDDDDSGPHHDDDEADDGDHDESGHDAPGHDHAFTFRDFLPQGGNSPALPQALVEELTHFLQDGDGGLAALLSQLPLFQNLPQDLRDAVQNSVAHAEQSHETEVGGKDTHGHHQWDHLI